MDLPRWPHEADPFHDGERAVQARAGSQAHMADIGRRVMRAEMPDQHRQFFELLPFIALGAVTADGQPRATLLAGPRPGFVRSPGATRLRVDALPPAGDPITGLLQPGAPIGLLGIELPTRRRNRANGQVAGIDAQGFDVDVTQSFGNCPRYIQRRAPVAVDAGPEAVAPVQTASRLDDAAAARIAAADTFFIATHAGGDAAHHGSDVSHRGGRPGFVRVSDDGRVLTWPDFNGNGFFNTLGNLHAEPRAGLVFADFANGALLHVEGRAEIVWDGASRRDFAGAERLLRLRVDAVLHRPAAWPLRWRLTEPSPALEGTGVWDKQRVG